MVLDESQYKDMILVRMTLIQCTSDLAREIAADLDNMGFEVVFVSERGIDFKVSKIFIASLSGEGGHLDFLMKFIIEKNDFSCRISDKIKSLYFPSRRILFD